MSDWQEEQRQRANEETERLLWLRSLKPGDRVAYKMHTGYTIGSRYVIFKVERTTATQVIVMEGSREHRFCRKTGSMKGNGRSAFRRLEPVTKVVRDDLDLHELRTWISNLADRSEKLAKLDLKVLRALRAAYDENATK